VSVWSIDGHFWYLRNSRFCDWTNAGQLPWTWVMCRRVKYVPVVAEIIYITKVATGIWAPIDAAFEWGWARRLNATCGSRWRRLSGCGGRRRSRDWHYGERDGREDELVELHCECGLLWLWFLGERMVKKEDDLRALLYGESLQITCTCKVKWLWSWGDRSSRTWSSWPFPFRLWILFSISTADQMMESFVINLVSLLLQAVPTLEPSPSGHESLLIRQLVTCGDITTYGRPRGHVWIKCRTEAVLCRQLYRLLVIYCWYTCISQSCWYLCADHGEVYRRARRSTWFKDVS
jgi:hypothetical protein